MCLSHLKNIMKKVVIINNKRSGSSLLAMGLADNKSIKIFGEIFPESPMNRAPKHLYKEGMDGATFLQDDIFNKNKYSEEIQAVGFKLLYTQAHYNTKVKTAWKYLIENQDIYIIHLTRENMLESWISSKIALISGEYAVHKSEDNNASGSKEKRKVEPFNANPQECEAHFRFVTDYIKWVKVKFKKHPLIEIEYEKLVAQFEETIFNIQDFLSIPRVLAKKHLEKQQLFKPWEQLLNFVELRDYFSKSNYAIFFNYPEL